MKVATGTMLKAPLDTTISFVNYHLNIGVDRMFLYFDDPDDPAIEVLEGIPKVTCVRCTKEFWNKIPPHKTKEVGRRQLVCLMRALKCCKQEGIDWLFHIDVDELLHFPKGLHDTIKNTPPTANTFRVPPMEAIPEKLYPESPFVDSYRFRVFLSGLKESKRERQALRKLHPELFVDRYTRGHSAGKLAVRVSADPCVIKWHNSFFSDQDPIEYCDPDSFVLHYESNTFNVWKSKMDRWRIRDENFVKGRMKALLPQILRAREAYGRYAGDALTEKLENIYKELYFVNDEQFEAMKKHNLAIECYLDTNLLS